MKSDSLLDKIESLIGRGNESNIFDESKCRTLPSPRAITSYEYERFLVAWVLLTRLSQNELDEAWRKHGNIFSLFAICLLSNSDEENQAAVINHDVSENGSDSYNLLHLYYVRLVAQVTGRLTTPPPNDLRKKLYNSWKCYSTNVDIKSKTQISTVTRQSRRNPILVALNVDVWNTFLAWISLDSSLLSSDSVIRDIWNAYVAAYSTIEQPVAGLEKLNSGKRKGMISTTAESKFKINDTRVMMNILENLLDGPIEAVNDSEGGSGFTYHIGDMQRLIIVIFELQGTKCTSDELLSKILLWNSRRNQHEITNPRLRVLWDGWIVKNVGESLSKTKNNATLLRDPEIINAIEKIMLAYAVSPDVHDLRPIVWQNISKIIRTHGWSWIQKASLETSMCTWCQLACGEWKIQLDEVRKFSSSISNRRVIMNGCGSLITSVVQYLAEFYQRPDKIVPIATKSLMIIRKSIEDTFSLTSTYLKTYTGADDDTELALVLHLWSELYSEIDQLSSKETENMIECLRKLLLLSREGSLVRRLVLNALRLVEARLGLQRA